MCRKQAGVAIGRLCDKCDGKCPVCDSYVRPTTLVRICDECSFGNYQNKCVVCGGEGISDAFYCFECTRLEKDRDGCPKIINLGSSRTDVSEPPPSLPPTCSSCRNRLLTGGPWMATDSYSTKRKQIERGTSPREARVWACVGIGSWAERRSRGASLHQETEKDLMSRDSLASAEPGNEDLGLASATARGMGPRLHFHGVVRVLSICML